MGCGGCADVQTCKCGVFGGLMCSSVVRVRCTVLLVCTALVCTGVHGGVNCIGVG